MELIISESQFRQGTFVIIYDITKKKQGQLKLFTKCFLFVFMSLKYISQQEVVFLNVRDINPYT